MTKIDKKTDYDTWYLRNYARGISITFISLWISLAVAYALDPSSPDPSELTYERIILWSFLFSALTGVSIAWWREGIGGLVLTVVGLAAIIVFMLTNKPEDYWITLITGAPFLVSGVLYLKCWKKIRKPKIP